MAVTVSQQTLAAQGSNVPASVMAPLRPMIIAPQAQLYRYAIPSERALAALGDYIEASATSYTWPVVPTNGIVDTSYAKLYAGTALLRYYHKVPTGGSAAFTAVSGTTDSIQAPAAFGGFVNNTFRGAVYARNAAFYDRDCQVGDVVKVTGGGSTVQSTIKGFSGTKGTGVVVSVSNGTSNSGAVTQASSVIQTIGPFNELQLDLDPATVSQYDGSASGCLTEKYIITVTKSSTGGVFSTATLSITSNSGLDNIPNIVPGNTGVDFTLGTRGLKAYFTLGSWYGSYSSEKSHEISVVDLLEGQQWVVSISQTFTPPTVACGGTYTGPQDTVYQVQVTRGGTLGGATRPQITVSTSNGVDASLPVNVSNSGVATNVGTYGTTITFSGGTKLRAGDIYYITTQAPGISSMNIIQLNSQLPAAITGASDLDVVLYIQELDRLIPAQSSTSGVFNYTVNSTGITINSSIVLEDPTWTNGGVEMAIPLDSADIYVEYRVWLVDNTSQVHAITSDADYTAVAGQEHPDNPLKFALKQAWANSNGSSISYLAITDPTSQSAWQYAINRITGINNCWSIVPCTDNRTVLDLFAAHVASQSDETVAAYRNLWVCPAEPTAVAVLSVGTDNSPVYATVSGTTLTVTSNNINLTTLNLRAGDLVQVGYGADAWGNATYSTYVLNAVTHADALTLVSGPSVPLGTPGVFQIWRNQTLDDLTASRSALAAHYGSTLVRLLWPDTVGDGTYTFSGYFAAAALAGLRGCIPPNRSLTNAEIYSIIDVSESARYTNPQLDAMQTAGVMVLVQASDGTVVPRYAVTTAGMGDVTSQEEMVIANYQARHFQYHSDLQDLYSTTNTTEATMGLIKLRLTSSIALLRQSPNALLGPMLIDATINTVARSLVIDKVMITITETIPVPMDSIQIQSTIVT